MANYEIVVLDLNDAGVGPIVFVDRVYTDEPATRRSEGGDAWGTIKE